MTPYIGEIRLFAGNFAPVNWHICDGSQLNIADYNALFALLGTTYGGNGVSTFGLPDFRGRVGISQGHGTATDATNHALGQTGGTETVTLNASSMPAHNHALNTAGTGATTATFGPTVTFANTTGQNTMYVNAGGTPATASPAATTIGNTGGGQAHDNVMPGLGVNYIISLAGLYPTFP